MRRKEALAKLIAKVEAGDLPEAVFHGSSSIRGHWAYVTGLDARQRTNAYLAYNGSLDAAKALHEAVLPGAWAHVRYTCKYGHATVDVDGEEYDANNADNPARAWLLAILKALHAQEAAE